MWLFKESEDRRMRNTDLKLKKNVSALYYIKKDFAIIKGFGIRNKNQGQCIGLEKAWKWCTYEYRGQIRNDEGKNKEH